MGRQEAGTNPAPTQEAEAARLYGTLPRVFGEELIATLKLLAGSVPVPRYDPCYGLDRADGPGLRALELLTRQGDFRKYVTVLDVGSGLGGGARWLSSRYGCRILALDVCPDVLGLGRRLSVRTSLASRVWEVAGSFAAVPLPDGRCTQIWSVETLHHARDRHQAIRELFRVLRPGCTLALQEVVRRSERVPVVGGPWNHGTEAEYLDALGAAGFTHIARDDVTRDRAETSPVVLSARETLSRRITDRLPDVHPWRQAQADLARLRTITAGEDYRTVQFFATRPSTSA